MPLYHLTLSQGRSDTVTCESSSQTKLLDFFKTVSTAVVRNIKEIVYSKDYNINYTPSSYIEEGVYHRVVVYASSQNYSKTFVLFNIKQSVTEDKIKKQFKNLLINNEPIIDFIDITFYTEGDSPTSYNNLYQVQYKRNSKTYIENLYAKSYEQVLEFANELIGGEITEIRKFLHHDSKVKKDYGTGYFKSISFSCSVDNAFFHLKVPKVKDTFSHFELKEMVSNTFQVHTKPINKAELKLKYN
jgi:hypothetical protein